MVLEAEKLNSEEAKNILVEWEIEQKRRRAIQVLIMGERYISRYLADYKIEIGKDFSDNPLTLTVKVYIPTPKEEKEEESEKVEEVSEG